MMHLFVFCYHTGWLYINRGPIFLKGRRGVAFPALSRIDLVSLMLHALGVPALTTYHTSPDLGRTLEPNDGVVIYALVL